MPRTFSIYCQNPTAINVHVADAAERGVEISDGCVEAIAGLWHSGQGSPFYAFASSGHFDRAELLRELSDTIATSYALASPADRAQLDMMGTYLTNRQS
jgi:hypothetical protein